MLRRKLVAACIQAPARPEFGWKADSDPGEARYGCFLPDLTGLARCPSTATFRAHYIRTQARQCKKSRAGKSAAAMFNQPPPRTADLALNPPLKLIEPGAWLCQFPRMPNDVVLPAGYATDALPGLSRSERNFFGHTGLDRGDLLRKDAAWIAARLAQPETRLVAVWRSRNLMILGQAPDAPPHAVVSTVAQTPGLVEASEETVFLGIDTGGTAWFALDLSSEDAPLAHPDLESHLSDDSAEFMELREAGHLLDHVTGSILAYARGMLTWHRRHRFCGICGSPAVSAEGGHVRRCTGERCGTGHFPRTDPAVIMLVTDGDRALLGRSGRFGPHMYSTLAGFVEPGETLEAAVAREVFEEAGINVKNVRYHSSQPWPFPTSLMLGFFAEATSTEITINEEEMEDVRWFEKSFLVNRKNEAERINLPRKVSIARKLIDAWLEA